MNNLASLSGAIFFALAFALSPVSSMADEAGKTSTYFKGTPSVAGPGAIGKGEFKMPTPGKKEIKKNTFMPALSAEAKMKAMQSMMYFNPFSLKDMINFMAAKKLANSDLSFEDVVESLKTKGNELNMRFVGASTPWKIIREIYDKDYPKVEIFSFCDLETLARILEYSPEFIVFIPCRIAVMEDREGKVWLVTLDWDVRWMDAAPNPNRISADLRKRAISIRSRLEQMMQAAATGDF